MSLANPLWGAPRIHGELLKLGIDVGQTSVAKYMTRRRRPHLKGEGHSSATTPMGRCPRRSSDQCSIRQIKNRQSRSSARLSNLNGRVVAGWGLVLAARKMGLIEVPAVSLTDLSEAELRTLRLALNRITDDSIWEGAELALEFSEILELAPQIDLEVSGFQMGEIDFFLPRSGRRVAGG
jgi:hypothetical protein